MQQQKFKIFKILKKMLLINLKNKYKNNLFVVNNKNNNVNNNEMTRFLKNQQSQKLN